MNKQKGYTFIELLCVIAGIMIIAGLVSFGVIVWSLIKYLFS